MKFKHKLLVLALASICFSNLVSASTYDSPKIIGTLDATTATVTEPNRSGTVASLPGTCAVSSTYFATDATAGQNAKLCTATNTWTYLLQSTGSYSNPAWLTSILGSIVSGDIAGNAAGLTVLPGLATGILKNTTTTGVLSIATGADLPAMTATVGGAVPTPPNNTTTYLRGDGTFATPAGGMTYPGAGVANSTGSAWGTSYAVGTSASNLVQLDGSAKLPAVDGSQLTSLPTTTGSCGYAANNFRLGASTTAVSSTDVYGSTNLYENQYRGNCIGLYSGSAWVIDTSTGFSLALSSLTGNLPYDVYVYDSSGTPTIELTAWTNATTRATDIALQDGVKVKSGDATRRWVGTIKPEGNVSGTVTISNATPAVITYTGHTLACDTPFTLTTTGTLPTGLSTSTTYYVSCTGNGTVGGVITTNTFNPATAASTIPLNTSSAGSGTHTIHVSTFLQDTLRNRNIYNSDNKVPRPMFARDYSADYPYTTATIRQCNADIGMQLNFVIGNPEDVFIGQSVTRAYNTSATYLAAVLLIAGVDLDNTTGSLSDPLTRGRRTLDDGTLGGPTFGGIYAGTPGIGVHKMTCIEYSASGTGTTNWQSSGTSLNGILGD